MILVAKLVVECPKTGVEVTVSKVCAMCKRYRFVGWRGLTPYVMCGD